MIAEGFQTIVEHTGEAGLYRATTEPFDLVLLDLLLPDRDGLDFVRTLRGQGIRTRILVVTGLDSITDRVSGLNAGADDYVVKPFALPELVARARALLRRSPPASQPLLRVGSLSIDLVRRETTRRGQRIDLTTREFELLAFFMRHAGQILSRESLAHGVYGQDRSTTLDNLIDVHVARLRQKLDEPDVASPIYTVRGIGFMLREPRA